MTRPGYELSFTAPAGNDFIEIRSWSTNRFGEKAADRYEALIGQAVHDVREDPFRAGARHRPELAKNIYIYHLVSSRDRMTAEDRVKAPRHLLLYRVDSVRVEILRILHDSRDLARHLP